MNKKKFWNLDKIRISVIFNIVLLVNIFVLVFTYMIKVNENYHYKERIQELENQLATEVSALKDQYESTIKYQKEDIDTLKNNYIELQQLSLSVNETNKELLQDNDELEDMNLKLMDENKDLADRVSMYEEYNIFMFRETYKSPRTDCSYELLKYFEEQIKDKDVNYLPFYCSWIMIESTWNNHDLNSRSYANGLPQFLPNTGKFVYEQLLNHGFGTYEHNMVTDPYTSIPMMVSYVHYLLEIYNGDLHKTIDSYRGLHDEPYLKRFNQYLAYFDTNIDEVAEIVKENYYKSHLGGGQG